MNVLHKYEYDCVNIITIYTVYMILNCVHVYYYNIHTIIFKLISGDLL